MNKHQLQGLANQKLLTDVGLVSHYMEHEDELSKITIEDLGKMGFVTSQDMNSFIYPDFENGGEFTLQKDLHIVYPIIIDKETIIDLNGHNIINDYAFIDDDNTSNSYVFWVKKGGKLTIKGEGAIKSTGCEYSIAIWAQGGDVIIEGGSYYNEGEGSDLIYASAGGNINITNGNFHPCKKLEGVVGTLDKYSALNIKDADRKTSSINVSGGIFYNFDPANNLAEGPDTNFVMNGYISNQINENVWEVIKSDNIEDDSNSIEE